jgi:hypothetical protein
MAGVSGTFAPLEKAFHGLKALRFNEAYIGRNQEQVLLLYRKYY